MADEAIPERVRPDALPSVINPAYQMISGFVPYGSSRIHYLYSGSGKTVIIALHGYGRSAESFSFLQKYIGQHYRILAIDLPFHGATTWQDSRPFAVEDLAAIIESMGSALGIDVSEYIVMGFSIGGKIALALAEHDYRKVLKLVLIAPDGVRVNFWYWLATQTWAGYHLFRLTMKHPQWLLGLLGAVRRYKMADTPLIGYAFYYLQDEDTRAELLNRWVSLSKCGPRRSKLSAIIRKHQVPVRALFGRHDPIIPHTAARCLCQETESWCQVHIVEAGHHLLNERHARIITQLLTT